MTRSADNSGTTLSLIDSHQRRCRGRAEAVEGSNTDTHKFNSTLKNQMLKYQSQLQDAEIQACGRYYSFGFIFGYNGNKC